MKAIDNTSAVITKTELKYLTGLFIDYDTITQLHTKDLEKISILERIIFDKDDVILLKDQSIELLKRRLDIVTPAWYDKFYVGFAAGIVLMVSIVIFAK